jgi:hypothetical protein
MKTETKFRYLAGCLFISILAGLTGQHDFFLMEWYPFTQKRGLIIFQIMQQNMKRYGSQFQEESFKTPVPWPPQLTPSKFQWAQPCSLLVIIPRPTCSDALTPMLINGRATVDSVRHLRAHLQRHLMLH